MLDTQLLIHTLKQQLKQRGITYKRLAQHLALSEASIKRMFAAERMTLDRLAQIGRLLDMSFSELAALAEAQRPRISSLSLQDERMLVADAKLLLTALCALNHWKVPEIIATYQLSHAECLQKLLALDKLRILDLLPGDRIRLLIARDFAWIADGPISAFFKQHGQADFLDHGFVGNDSLMFSHGMLTAAAYAELQPELQRLKARFTQLHEQSLASPSDQKRGCGMLLASRQGWEPPIFSSLRRDLPGETGAHSI